MSIIYFERTLAPTWARRFCPHEQVNSVCLIEPEHLQSLGIEAVGLDLDNTLTPWKSHEFGEGVEDWLESLKQSGIKLCIISNSRRKERLTALSKRLNIPYVQGPMKPSPVIFRIALKLIPVEAKQWAMIGDQMFTDIWGGNRMGMYTIWVNPMHSREFFGTKASRQIEKIISRVLEKCRVNPVHEKIDHSKEGKRLTNGE